MTYLALALVFLGSIALGASILLRRRAPGPPEITVEFVPFVSPKEQTAPERAAVTTMVAEQPTGSDAQLTEPRRKRKSRSPSAERDAQLPLRRETPLPTPPPTPATEPLSSNAPQLDAADEAVIEKETTAVMEEAEPRRSWFGRLFARFRRGERSVSVDQQPRAQDTDLPPLQHGWPSQPEVATPLTVPRGESVKAEDLPLYQGETDDDVATGLLELPEATDEVEAQDPIPIEHPGPEPPTPVPDAPQDLVPEWASHLGLTAWPVAPDHILTLIDGVLRSEKIEQIALLAAAFRDTPEVRRSIVSALADAMPEPETLIPLSFAMVEYGDDEARMLAVGLLFAAGLTDEAAACLGASPEIDGLLAFHAIRRFGIEGACAWLIDHGVDTAHAGQLIRAAAAVVGALNGSEVA